ncbi:hypothetical protein KC333_g6486 [Hortaea werneckii]|nr:hypothetical protein KC333_g6486 [Hortaea werneckii]KAI7310582.1 hypothetical protein KC326_g6631 [Hortaea werneckii]
MAAVPRNPFEARREVAEGWDDGSDSGSEAVNDEQQDDESHFVTSERSHKVIDMNEYTEYMGGEFQEKGLENGEETAIISRHYDQCDFPVQKITGRRRKEDCVIVVFQDTEGNMGEPCCVGSFAEPAVYCEWQLSSQNPGLKIRITTAPGVVPKREAICRVPLAAIKRSYDDNGNLKVHCSMRFGHDLAIREDVNWTPSAQELTDHAYQDSLMQVHLEVWQDVATAPRFETGPQPCAISWRGLSLRELSAIDANHDAQEGPYGAFEYMVTLFRRSKDWRIYRRWNSEKTESAWVLKSWIAKSLFLTAKYGEMWHYQLQLNNEQPSQSVFASDTKLGKLKPPRNLVVDWLVETDGNGTAIGQPNAHRVQSYPVDWKAMVYASPAIMSLQLRLAIERDREPRMQILQSSFNTNQFDVIGTFHAHSNRPGLYVVDLRVPGDRRLNLECNLRAKTDTKLSMAVKPSEAAGLEEGWVGTEPILFDGVIIEDVFGSDEGITAIVEGPSLEPFVELRDGVELLVKVELKDDPTLTDRHQATVKEIEAGVQRTKGVDFPSLILRAPPSIVETDSLARQMTDVLRGLVMGVANVFNLDDEQTKAVSNATESSSGVTAICGTSGTGKSWNVAAIGFAHICVGKLLGGERRRPVLACAPTNVAVDTLMSHFLAGTNHDGTFDENNLVIVRYRGHLPREILDLADGLEFIDHADPYARYDFYVQLENKINEWAASETHVMKGTAQTFTDLRARMYASVGGRELSKSAAFDLKVRLGDAEDLLTSYFLQHAADIVFCTNSSSAQGMLRDWYRPKILLSDDLATCSIPDGATPVGAFKEHIEHWTLAGEYPGHKPFLASEGFNEWARILLQSLFKWTVESRLDNNFFVELGAQYRMDHHLEPVPKPGVKKKTRRGLKKKKNKA